MKKLLISIILGYCFLANGQIDFIGHELNNLSNFAIGAQQINCVDLDDDGFKDIVFTCHKETTISWYRSIPNTKRFEKRRVLIEMNSSDFIYSLGDIDNDGDFDIFYFSYENEEIAWLENVDGKGKFSNKNVIEHELPFGTISMVFIDMNGDNDLDVCFMNAFYTSSKIFWIENTDGNGNFNQLHEVCFIEEQIKVLRLGDIDKDSDPDVLFYSKSGLQWCENVDGKGSFGNIDLIIDDNFKNFSLSDLNSDGYIDIVGVNSNTSRIKWYENLLEDGGFSTVKGLSTLDIDSYTYSDLDNDGDTDLIVTTPYNTKLYWFENLDGKGDFSFEQLLSSEIYTVQSILGADIDQDNDQDLILNSNTSDGLFWYENLNDFNEGSEVFHSFSEERLYNYKLLDLNFDGDLDLMGVSKILGQKSSRLVSFDNQDGKGSFSEEVEILKLSKEITNYELYDIDGDQNFDFIFLRIFENYYTLEISEQISYNNETYIVDSIDISSYRILFGDINNDGLLDILLFDVVQSIISFYLQETNGSFKEAIVLQQIVSEGIYNNVLVDLDQDSDLDIIVEDKVSHILYFIENINGSNDFESPKAITQEEQYGTSYTCVDYDLDGDLDLVGRNIFSTDYYSNNWYENLDGKASFGTKQIIVDTIPHSYLKFPVDIDIDGDLDLILYSTEGKLLWLERINGTLDFYPSKILVENLKNYPEILMHDIDHDGDLDFFVCEDGNEVDSRTYWLENKLIFENKITGKVLFDVNSNGCDGWDIPVANIKVSSESNQQLISHLTNAKGEFRMYPENGNQEVSLKNIDESLFEINPELYQFNLTSASSEYVADFCLSPIQEISDVAIHFMELTEARPGFDAQYILSYENLGSKVSNGSIELEFDSQKLNFISSTENHVVLGDKINFEFLNLNPFEERQITIKFNIKAPPVVKNDDILQFSSSISQEAIDLDESNNSSVLNQLVIGSYDPNDIYVLEGEEVLFEDRDQYLHYRIRFQNTGTASAINVRVENVLDDNLDWNSIQIVSMSHPYRVQMEDDKYVRFLFDGIQLPDSLHNEPESHGYIIYKIKPKSDINVGDVIKNQASIYFDFNEAVVTNEVNTTFVEEIIAPEGGLNFTIHPNPPKDIFVIKSESPISEIQLFDNSGKRIKSNTGTNQMNILELIPGVYFVRVKDSFDNVGTKRLLIE